MEAIDCEEVWKVYNQGKPNEVRALQRINLKIAKGDFLAIMGSSGSGKSTIMNCIGCLDAPTKGKVLIDGKDVSKLSENQLALIRRNKIGFIFQFFNLIPSLTALQNVELPMVFNRIDERARKEKARKLLEEVGLANRLDSKPSELSGGEIQRVAIARALANDPMLILADEPTGNLDSKNGEEVMKIFSKLNEEGKTIIIVTHDLQVAKNARKIINMKDGMIVG